MKCHITQRRLPLRRPFSASGWTLTYRDILLFSVTDEESGITGWGESAPFSVFGTEDFAASAAALDEAARELASVRHIPQLSEFEASGLVAFRGDTPAADFAAECALLDLRSRIEGVSIGVLIGGHSDGRVPVDRVRVNAVVGMMGPDETAEAAVQAWEAGFTCLKLKVGAAALEDDIDRIRAVRMAVPEEMLLRLDANGAWEYPEAEEALREFSFYDIEYIEQPVAAADIDELAALTQLGIIPVAADESAQNLMQARELLERDAANLYVIKPMAAGSLLASLRFAMDARERGVDVVFTSLIDSSVGRHAVAQLCASLPFDLRHQGLATGQLFSEDTHADHLADGCFVIPEGPGLGIIPDMHTGAEPE
jgi:L-Ala-D/L-Glu epimerase